MTLTKRKLNDNIILIESDSQEELAKAFLRFQEYYESPKFAGQYFTLEEYKDWYTKGGKEEFTYYSDWPGFNVPGYVFLEFLGAQQQPLSALEIELIELLFPVEATEVRKSYVIGAVTGDAQSLKHEVAHALFYTNQEYHKEVMCILADHNVTYASFFNYLMPDYASTSWIDEMHAYLLTDADVLQKEGKIPTDTRLMKDLIAELETNYQRHTPLKEVK